jgi:hypothetical protein
MMPTQNEIDIVLRFLVDKTSQAAASGAILNIGRAVSTTSIISSQVLYQLQGIGRAAFSAIRAAERTFGENDPVIREWQAAQREIEDSWARIGRVLADEMLPAMEQIADLAEVAARLFEKFPGSAAGALLTGGAAATAGITAAQLGLGGPVSLAVGAGVGQVGAGLMAGQQMPPWLRPIVQGLALANPGLNLFGQGVGLSGVLESLQNLEIAGSAAGDAVRITDEELERFADAQDDLAKSTEKFAEKRESLEADYEERRAEIVDEYGRRMAELEQSYMAERARIVEDYNRERARAIDDFEREQTRAQEDFDRELARAEADYVRQVQDLNQSLAERLADITSQSDEAIEQLKRDHQQRLEDMEREHLLRVEDLVAARDAVGLALEDRRYQMERQAAEEDLQERIAEQRSQAQELRQQAIADHQQRLADLQAEYELERQRRLEDFNQRQAEAQEDFQVQQERRREEFQQRLEELDANHAQEMEQLQAQHQREMQQLEQNHRQKLNELQREYDQERQERLSALRSQMQELLGIEQQGHAALLTATQEYVNSLLEEAARLEGVAGGTSGSRQSGGYVNYGNWLLHDNEFVLSPNTTAQMEAMLGTRLNQSNLLAGMAGRRVTYGGAQQTINVNMSLPGGMMSQTERRQIISASKEAALSAFADVLENL